MEVRKVNYIITPAKKSLLTVCQVSRLLLVWPQLSLANRNCIFQIVIDQNRDIFPFGDDFFYDF